VQDTLQTPDCAGIDHADFTADGRTAVFTCEFAGRVAVVDVSIRKIDVGKGPHGLCVWPQPGRYSLGHTGIMR
jgi:hypothetical protein